MSGGDVMRVLFCAFLATLLFTALNLSAEEIPPLAEKQGKWSFTMRDDIKGVRQESLKKLRGSLLDISRIITSLPVMSPAKGFEARFWGSASAKDRYDACTGKKCAPSRPTATLAMMLGRYEEKNGKVRAAFNTPSTMDISINNLGHLFAHLPVLYKDAEGYLLPEPQLDGERAGMRSYSNNGHAIAVLTRNERPLWLPVSRERYLKAAIASTEESLKPSKQGNKKQFTEVSVISGQPILIEESRTWIDPAKEKKLVEKSRTLTFGMKDSVEVLQQRLLKLQAELAAMPPEQRTLQAKVDIVNTATGEQPTLLPYDSSSGVAVVTPDFSYFSPKLPAEAIQLIIVQWKFDGDTLYDPQKSGITGTLNNQKLLEIFNTTDWQKLAAKVTRTEP